MDVFYFVATDNAGSQGYQRSEIRDYLIDDKKDIVIAKKEIMSADYGVFISVNIIKNDWFI